MGSEDESSARDILRAVATRYESSIDYYMEVRTKSGSAAFDYTLAAARPHQFMMRQRSRTSDRFDLLLIATAASAWGYLPLKKRYTRNGQERCAEREELARVHRRYFGRFQLLDRIGVKASTTGKGNVRSNGQTVACVRVTLISPEQGWKEELWIDPVRHIVLKLVGRHRLPFPETGEATTESVWRQCHLDRPSEPATFDFEPPSGIQRTNGLEYRQAP